MARTRGAAQRFHQDDGEVLGKDGEPLNLNPHGRAAPAPLPASLLHMDDGELVPPAPKLAQPVAAPVVEGGVPAFQCDRKSIRRDLEAYELLILLEEVIGPIEMTLEPAKFQQLPADVRRHFRRVLVAPAPESE